MKHDLIEFKIPGLATCKYCGLSGGTLTTDCPREKIMDVSLQKIRVGYLDFIEGQGWVERYTTKQKIIHGLALIVPLSVGVLLIFAYMTIQGWVFNSEKYPIFVSLPHSVFGVILAILTPMILASLIILSKTNAIPSKMTKYFNRVFFVLIPISLLILFLAIFDYAGVNDNGVYWGHLLLSKQQFQSWNDASTVSISMSSGKTTDFYFVITFKDGKSIDLWDDNSMSELIRIKNILNLKGIPISIGKLDESDLPGFYKDNIQTVRQIFGVKTK